MHPSREPLDIQLFNLDLMRQWNEEHCQWIHELQVIIIDHRRAAPTSSSDDSFVWLLPVRQDSVLPVHESGLGKAVLWKKRFSFGETRSTGLCVGDNGPDLQVETLAGAPRCLRCPGLSLVGHARQAPCHYPRL